MFKKLLFLFCVMGLTDETYSQAEVRKITPLSPNAATIARYGETPISHFTGVPEISIPLYSIQGRELKVPISLSYHAGGNKVEDHASWVGLGWSLGSIPCISRSVRGIPDEDGLGYFNLYAGKTIKQLYDSQAVSSWQTLWATFLSEVKDGVADSEADIFHFSLIDRSGKFYYNQTTQKFYTLPHDNIKIERITNGFRITSTDGVIYDFNVPEFTYQYNQLIQSTTSWWISKIVNANRTDSIAFSYGMVPEGFMNTVSATRNTPIATSGSCIYPQTEISQSGTEVYSIKPDTIRFSTGYLKFVQQGSTRSDLSGSKALDRIEIYNYRDELIKKIRLKYKYPDGWNRLTLDSLWEVGSSGDSLPPHTFSYRTDISPPTAGYPVDYWGYYNGVNTNDDLVPLVWYQFPGNNYLSALPGADRVTDPDFVQFLILNKITYPTGGTTEFEYESHEVTDTTFGLQTVSASAVVSGNGTPQGTTAHYEQSFTINVPPDPILNGSQGGTLVNVTLGNLGCDLSGGANVCAQLFITDAQNNPVSSLFTENVSNLYIANGNYKLVADFNQDPPQYENFFFGLTWKKPDSTLAGKHFVGGLRIRKITEYDGVNHQNDIIKTYTYTSDTSDNVSSGKIFGLSYFSFIEPYFYKVWEPCPPPFSCCAVSCVYQLLKRMSYSTITAVSQSGSYVGYTKVDVHHGTSSQNGKSTYRFNHEIDLSSVTFPYPPGNDRSQRRGNLIESIDYRKSGSNYIPVKRVNNSYIPFSYYNVPTINNSIAKSLKIACRDVIIDPCNTFPELPEQLIELYDTQTDWMQLAQSTTKIYSSDDTTKYIATTSSYEHDTVYLQIKKVTATASNGDEITSFPKYPYDLSLTGTAETARLGLISQNRIRSPLQEVKKLNASQKKLTQTNFQQFFTGKIEPQNVEIQIESNTKETRVEFNKYDTDGNLIEQQKSSDVKQSYIYDYLKNYPVAEVVNADSSSIAYTSFEADGKGGWTFIGSTGSDGTSPTGSRCYSLSGGDITKSGLSNTTYVVSYWSKSGSAYTINGSSTPTRTGKTIDSWKYFEHEVTGDSIRISGNNYIDEVRLYPKGAMMTTYTYVPLIGMSSQCDVASRITYYEYDSFGRLKLVKDQDKNVIKIIGYKLQQSQNQ